MTLKEISGKQVEAQNVKSSTTFPCSLVSVVNRSNIDIKYPQFFSLSYRLQPILYNEAIFYWANVTLSRSDRGCSPFLNLFSSVFPSRPLFSSRFLQLLPTSRIAVVSMVAISSRRWSTIRLQGIPVCSPAFCSCSQWKHIHRYKRKAA
jgi:hypothetical protein